MEEKDEGAGEGGLGGWEPFPLSSSDREVSSTALGISWGRRRPSQSAGLGVPGESPR